MDQRLRTMRSALTCLFVLVFLFGVLSLLPAMAQPAGQEGDAPSAPAVPAVGDVSAQVLISSTTGYLIDDGGPGFTATVSPDGWLAAAVGYDGDCLYTSVLLGTAGDYAEWRPDLAAGKYEVLAYYVADSNRRTDVRYTVVHAGGTATTGYISQFNPVALGVWQSLGVYTFNGGTSGYVRLTDDHVGWGLNQYIIADAVKFAPLDVWVDDGYTPVSSGGHVWGVDAFAAIQPGVEAVASGGTVHVGAGIYYQTTPITLSKSLTLTGDSAATTVVSTTVTNWAVSVLASDVHLSKMTLESTDADYGIVNFDPSVGWSLNLTGVQVDQTVVHGFDYGIYLLNVAAEISNDSVYNNRLIGIWSQDYPNVGGASTISSNVLYGNGTGASTDEDIRVQGSYTGTVVSGNTITGDLAAGEAGIVVRDQANGLTLSKNSVLSCTQGISIVQDSNITAQKVTLQRRRRNKRHRWCSDSAHRWHVHRTTDRDRWEHASRQQYLWQQWSSAAADWL